MNLEERIALMAELGDYILSENDELKGAIFRSCSENAWFDYDAYYEALTRIAHLFLKKEKLLKWIDLYNIKTSDHQKIGLILAGNLPMVGFHDVLCVFITGHIAQIKLSDRDKHVLPLLVKVATQINSAAAELITFTDRLNDYDAIIATGSESSRLQFEYYFKDYPSIIRGNRNGIAVLNGTESVDSLVALSDDIFQYYGLGCRSISKIYVPEGYDFKRLIESMEGHRDKINHSKFRNNYDYNLAIFMLNRIEHVNTGFLLLKEDANIQSRIATLHFEYYTSIEDVQVALIEQEEKIQCVTSDMSLDKLKAFKLGDAQKPKLNDYADGKDVMAWLSQL